MSVLVNPWFGVDGGVKESSRACVWVDFDWNSRDILASFQEENLLSSLSESSGNWNSTRTTTDDDVIVHVSDGNRQAGEADECDKC